MKKQSLANTGKAPAKKVTSVSANRPAVTPKGKALREMWLGILSVTSQIAVTKGGLVKEASREPTSAELALSWAMLAVPHHVKLGTYDRAKGITAEGIKKLNADGADGEVVAAIVKKMKAKVPAKGFKKFSVEG